MAFSLAALTFAYVHSPRHVVLEGAHDEKWEVPWNRRCTGTSINIIDQRESNIDRDRREMGTLFSRATLLCSQATYYYIYVRMSSGVRKALRFFLGGVRAWE